MARRRTTARLHDGPAPYELADVPYRHSRLRIYVTIGVVLAVLAPILVHALRLDSPSRIEPAARTFYVGPNGDDRLDGSTPNTAWRSLDRANAIGFKPGDRLLLQGGATLRGSIRFGPGEAGDASDPVVVDSYGPGRATIEASGVSAVTVYDTAGVDVRNLALIGDAAAFVGFGGIKLYNDLPGDRKLDNVVISRVDITGFKEGIDIGGGMGATGFRNVRVSDAVLHGNRDAGLISTGPVFNPASPSYAHEAISISGVDAYDNLGDPKEPHRSTGNGIVLGSVRDGLIEQSSAHDNGALSHATSGPVGIWAYDSAAVVIQHDVAYRNHRAGQADGGGFDLDKNVSSSVLQYNLSHDNDGAGYLLYSPRPSEAGAGNTIRFNISSNDARKSSRYAGMTLTGVVNHAQIYHNTVVIGPNGPVHPSALVLRGRLSGVTIRNNIFMADRTNLLTADPAYSTSQVLMQGNDLFRASKPWLVSWGSTSYSSLVAWRQATGQERVKSRHTGLSADPGFITATGLAREANPANVFTLTNNSVLVGQALDLRSLFGVDPGSVDYFGKPITRFAAIGAVQPAVRR